MLDTHHALSGVADPAKAREKCEAYIRAGYRMRSQWSESSPEKQQELWSDLHRTCAEAFEALGMPLTPAPSNKEE